jgi:hypothetical protein
MDAESWWVSLVFSQCPRVTYKCGPHSHHLSVNITMMILRDPGAPCGTEDLKAGVAIPDSHANLIPSESLPHALTHLLPTTCALGSGWC